MIRSLTSHLVHVISNRIPSNLFPRFAPWVTAASPFRGDRGDLPEFSGPSRR